MPFPAVAENATMAGQLGDGCDCDPVIGQIPDFFGYP